MINSKFPITAGFVVFASPTVGLLQDVQNAIKSVRISTKIEQFKVPKYFIYRTVF